VKKYLFLLYILLVSAVAQAQDITGDWMGTLQAGQVELRLALHIKTSGTGYTGTLDSIDQGANGIPLSDIVLKDSKLTFQVPAVMGSYEGTLKAGVITGQWTQGQSLDLEFRRNASGAKPVGRKPGKPSDIDSAWLGKLDEGFMGLRLQFHIANMEDGLSCTLDSLDQGAKGIPCTSITRDASTLKIDMKSIGASYEGKIDDKREVIDGTFTQMGKTSPLKLTRAKEGASLEPKRPQVPVKPYPYREEEVVVENPKAQGVKLAGTLTIPPGKGPFTAVILITGSGAQDRDESLLGHQPFLILADALTRKGIEVLRVDDRGFAKSTGNFATATSADFATDAEAQIAFLKTRPEVNPKKIGLIGHSEGGLIAPMVAARNPDVAFIVMMAGPGVPGDQILIAQQQAIAKSSGVGADKLEKSGKLQGELLALIKQSPPTMSDAELAKQLEEKLKSEVPPAQAAMMAKQVTGPWFRYFLAYDPAPTLAKVQCPVLAINGELDQQVSPKQNLPPIRKAFEDGHNKDFEVLELPGLNHLFQTAKTGSPSEYAVIEETMSPKALDIITTWVSKR
jgi:pimeloyl-ACP methyl ester carboxylesterase